MATKRRASASPPDRVRGPGHPCHCRACPGPAPLRGEGPCDWASRRIPDRASPPCRFVDAPHAHRTDDPPEVTGRPCRPEADAISDRPPWSRVDTESRKRPGDRHAADPCLRRSLGAHLHCHAGQNNNCPCSGAGRATGIRWRRLRGTAQRHLRCHARRFHRPAHRAAGRGALRHVRRGVGVPAPGPCDAVGLLPGDQPRWPCPRSFAIALARAFPAGRGRWRGPRPRPRCTDTVSGCHPPSYRCSDRGQEGGRVGRDNSIRRHPSSPRPARRDRGEPWSGGLEGADEEVMAHVVD